MVARIALLLVLRCSAWHAPTRVRYMRPLSAAPDAEALAELRVPDLKDQCRALGLPVSGTKAVLIERILEADGAPAANLSELQRIDSRGVCPRHFELDFEEPSSPLLRVGNQDTQTVATFPIRSDGTLGLPEVTTTDGICPGILAR